MTSEVGVILRGNSAHLLGELQKAGAEVVKFSKQAEQSLRGVKDESQSLGSAVSVLGGQMGVALSAGFAVSKVLEFRTAIQGAQVDIDKLRNALTYGMGGAAVTQEVDYLRKATNAMGLEFASTSQLYAKFAAAARGTALEGKGVKDVFESIGKAGTVMGLGAGEMQGVMLALTQILSKGTVQAEEIRGQLGERLPGAFAIASRAMGVTTAEFGKLLETGQVMSTDFLPKFAEQMEKEFAGSFEKASQSMQASMNRLSNAWTDLKTSLAEDAGAGQAIASLNDKIASTFSTWALNVRGMASSTGFKDWFYSAFYSVEGLDLELNVAKDSLAKLDKNLAAAPSNIYARSAVAEMRAYIKELETAKQKQDALQGISPSNAGPGDVSNIAAQYPSRSQSYATEEARLGKIKAGMVAVQVAASGVDANFQKHLSALKAGFDEGLMSQERYVSDVAALIQKEGGIRKGAAPGLSDAAKANAAFVKADIDGARIMMDLREKAQGEAMKQAAESLAAAEKTWAAYQKAEESTATRAMESAIAAETELANYGLLKSAVQELELVRLESARNAALSNQEDVTGIEKRIEAQKRLIAATRGLEGRTASDEAAKLTTKSAADAAAEWKKTSDSINSTLTDALMRGFESGKGFARNLRDTIVNMFKTLVLRPIISAVMSPISAAITGGLGLSGAAQAAGGANALSTVGTGASMYNAFGTVTGLMTEFGTAALASTQSLIGMSGTAAQLSQSMALGTGGSTAGTLGAMAPYALAAVAALAAVGAFRTTKQTGTGISGTLGNDASLTGFNEMRKSGYLFGGPEYRDELKALDPLMAKALTSDFAAIKAAATGAADALGLASTSVAGFTKAFRIEFTGDKAKDEALYKDLLAGTADDLARGILGSYKETIATVIEEIQTGSWSDGTDATFSSVERQVKTTSYTPSEFAREGETASQTLTRLATSITLVNGMSGMLGNKLMAVGLSGANTASLLIDAFGGAESYAQNMAGYYSSFYTQAEQTAYLTETTSAAFAALGKTMPVLDENARKVYRGMVTAAAGLDMTVEANRVYYAGLIALQGPMNELAPAFDTAATSVTELIDTITEGLTKSGQDLAIELLKAQGKTSQAMAAQRALDTKDYTAAQVALYDYNQGLRDQITTLNTLAGLQQEYDDLTLTQAQQRNKIWLAQNAADPTGMVSGAQIKVWDKQDEKAAAQVTSDYNRAMLEASGNTSGLAAFDQAISDAALIAAGWTKTQIDAIDAAKTKTASDAAKIESDKAAAKVVSDYSRALLEASGNTSGLAAFDKATSDAALITAGWTQAQVDLVNATKANTAASAAKVASDKAAAQVTSDYNRAMLEASGNTSGLAAFDKATSDAALITAGWTQAQVDTVNTTRQLQETLATLATSVKSLAADVDSALASIADIRLQSDIDAANATNALAENFGNLSKSLKDFVSGETLQPSALFGDLLKKALTGDAQAMQSLPGAATGAVDFAKERAASSVDFALAQARIMVDVTRAANKSAELAALTVNVPQRQDPMVAAIQNLQTALVPLLQGVKDGITLDLVNKLGTIDTNLSGAVDVSEFIKYFDGTASDSVLTKIFNEFDSDSSGLISKLEATRLNTLETAQKIGTTAAGTGTGTTGTGTVSSGTAAANAAANDIFSLADLKNTALGQASATGVEKSLITDAFVKRLLDKYDANKTGGWSMDEINAGGRQGLIDSVAALQSPEMTALLSKPVTLSASDSALLNAAKVLYLSTRGGVSSAVYNAAEARVGGNLATAVGWDGSPYNLRVKYGFATGGAFTNGIVSRPTAFNVAEMGEAGPEAIMPLANINGSLGVRFAGNSSNDALVAEIRALRQEVAELRKSNTAENSAIASHTALTADSTRRMDKNGVLVYTDPAEPLKTEAVA